MTKKKEEIYRFQLSFKGDLVENSVDAYAVANTILATSQALSQIAEIKYGEGAGNQIKININAFKQGSFISDFLIYAAPLAVPATVLLPCCQDVYKTGKEMLSTFKLILDIKKELKGKRPKKVVVESDSHIEIHGDNNKVMVINVDDLRALQDKTISRSINKIAEPLLKDDSEVKEVGIIQEEEGIISINREEAGHLVSEDEVQMIPEIKYKGTISKIDTKTCTGFIDLHARRVSLEYPKDLVKEQFDILIDSLRNRIQIYLTGSVEMDLESNPKKVFVAKVDRDEVLF